MKGISVHEDSPRSPRDGAIHRFATTLLPSCARSVGTCLTQLFAKSVHQCVGVFEFLSNFTRWNNKLGDTRKRQQLSEPCSDTRARRPHRTVALYVASIFLCRTSNYRTSFSEKCSQGFHRQFRRGEDKYPYPTFIRLC